MPNATQDILANLNACWLMDIATDAIFIVDTDGYILRANPAAERLFGYTHEQLLQINVKDLIPYHRDFFAYSDSGISNSALEIIGLCQDGSEFAADLRLNAIEGGWLLATLHNLARRKNFEQALATSRGFAESIVDTLQEPLVLLDAEGRVVSANKVFYQVFQLTEEQTLGQTFFELNARQWDIPVLRELLAEVLPQQRKIKAFELQHDFSGIGSRTVLINARVIEGRIGEPNLSLLTFLNITECKQLEAEQARMIHELQSINNELRNFAYVISHDLKAPLRAIGSLADWIVADQKDRLDAEGQEHLRLLIQRVRRMDALIDGVLAYSRIGRIREALGSVDCNERVQAVLDALAPPDHIAIKVAPGLPVIQAEKTALYQVLQNLIANAIRYQDKPEGQIEINCTELGESWQFSVSDNGSGIESRHFGRIFQLFQTLNSRDKVESTGVGLAIVKKIVELFGGRIWVESTVNQGSHFYFTVPKGIPVTSEK